MVIQRWKVALSASILMPCALQCADTVVQSERLRFGAPIPVVDQGWLLFRGLDSATQPGAANVEIFDREGNLRVNKRFQADGVAHVDVLAVAMGRGSTPAVAATMVSREGAVDYVIGVLEQDGRTRRIIRTNPFVPLHLTYAPDGTLWSLGRNFTSDQQGENYPLLEHYSAEGVRLGSALNRSSIASVRHPASPSSEGGHSFIQASQNSIGVYLGTSQQWLEFDLQGTERSRIALKRPTIIIEGETHTGRVIEWAFVDGGDVFASFQFGRSVATLERLDKRTGTWERLRTFNGSAAPPSLLVGKDGNKLVMLQRPREGEAELTWLAP